MSKHLCATLIVLFGSLSWLHAANTAAPQPGATASPTAGNQADQAPATTTQPADAKSVDAKSGDAKPADAKKEDGKKDEKKAPFVTRAWGAKPMSDPPPYVQSMGKYHEKLDWLDFGLEHRTRFEYRNNDYLRSELTSDAPFLLRSRAYIGVKKIMDPFRVAFELNDAQKFNSKFPATNSEVNNADILQLYGELFFDDVFGKGEPFRFRFGRMTLDLIDTKLVNRTGWRSAPQSFDGFRVTMGKNTSDFSLDIFAVRPVERRLHQMDRTDEERMFYGIIPAVRKWSKYVTLEPYYLILAQQLKDPTQNDRQIHTMGLHAFGPIGNTGFDWDTDTAFQFGKDGDRFQRAFAMAGEVGYTFKHPWNPRISSSTSYASGDDTHGHYNNRFDNLYGNNHGYSMSDLFQWKNDINTKLRLELKPSAKPWDKFKFNTAFGGHWLASRTDAWTMTGLRDKTGKSGNFLGTEWETQLIYAVCPNVDLELGYSWFFPGQFVRATRHNSVDSQMFYVSVTTRLP